MLNILLKNGPNTSKFCQSRETSPTLVTLLSKIRDKRKEERERVCEAKKVEMEKSNARYYL